MQPQKASVFKFATIRNGELKRKTASGKMLKSATEGKPEIILFTPFVKSIIAVNELNSSNQEKIKKINNLLIEYTKSAAFIASTAALDAAKAKKGAASDPLFQDQLYDNIIVRLFGKGNNNQLFKDMTDELKSVFVTINGLKAVNPTIVIPQELTLLSLNASAAAGTAVSPAENTDRKQLEAQIDRLNEVETLLTLAEQEGIVRFEKENVVVVENYRYRPVVEIMQVSKATLSEAEKWITGEQRILNGLAETTRGWSQRKHALETVKTLVNQAKAEGVKTFEQTTSFKSEKYAPVLEVHKAASLTVEAARMKNQAAQTNANKAYLKTAANARFSKLGSAWVNQETVAGHFVTIPPDGTTTVEDDGIVVWMNGCELKYPFYVADLRTVEHETVGYLPGEIAHISNTQAGEENTRVTRRLKRIESYESLISEQETFNETDTQSTEKFSLESEASRVQEEESNWNVNAKVSTKWNFATGSITASVDGGFATSNSVTSSNSIAQHYAKELFTRTIERVSNKVKLERSVKTLEEFEETVTHVVDNKGEGPKSYVYRWLNKLTRATLKNYGKRLMFQLDIAHPAHYYLSRSLAKEAPTVTIPEDPRTDAGVRLTINSITRANVMMLAEKYNAKVDVPPPVSVLVTDTFKSDGQGNHLTKLVPIPKGYICGDAQILCQYHDPEGEWQGVRIQIGLQHVTTWWEQVTLPNGSIVWRSMQGRILFNKYHFWAGMNGETDQLPVSIYHPQKGFIMNLESRCWISPEAELEWKKKAYYAILEGYEAMKQQAESQLSDWNPNAPGLNPSRKDAVIMEELKKEAIRKMNRCRPFNTPSWNGDTFAVGQEYNPNCCTDNHHGAHARFLETVFDWNNLTYEFHPYFYANHNDWRDLLNLTDDDPHFEAFLRASYATIRIPVHRDSEKEIAAINYIMYNVIGNYLTAPDGVQPIIDELSNEPASLFTYDIDGNEIPEPSTTIDLGVFNIPTDLVILECGTTEGVKPIGFPQSTDEPTSDVIIPRQFSPAIIADSCQQ